MRDKPSSSVEMLGFVLRLAAVVLTIKCAVYCVVFFIVHCSKNGVKVS